ncbi:MAG TPA: PilT/PilU family type 4a pilus ATPase [Coriobacteriia bacterium]|nr:PilT/PilU family type 4a pilus ATPase [Coriobacteriia bacterium]
MADKKVLIVHDDADFIEQVKGGLAQGAPGVAVTSALSGPRALGIIQGSVPDAIVVDAELVGMDGYALTQQIKSDAKTKDVPVVIVTLSPNEASALRARQVGASAHLSAAGSVQPIVNKVAQLVGVAVTAPAAVPAMVGAAVAGAGRGGMSPATVASLPTLDLPQVVPVTPATGAPLAGTAPGAVAVPGAAYGVPTAVAPLPATPKADGGYGAPQPAAASEVVIIDEDTPHIDDLLRLMLQRGGSDLHVTVGSPPGIRQRGEIVPVEAIKALTPRDTMEMILGLLSEEQRKRFETELELDFAYSIPGVARFRANVFQQRNSMGAVFRVIPIKIPTIDELALPKVVRFLADRPRGLVLVTGPTGSGKSTTLAAIVDHINANKAMHIITLEDPIEFMHRNKKSYINQREIGEDTHSFASALKRVLRQDPDVVLVGELRDLETISAAITAAETGHLVLATLHTTGGPETVDRIIDVFPPHQQQQVRMQLSTSLEGVLSQTLLRSTDGRSRILAMEIMLGIPAISNLIREGKTHQMETIIQGGAQLGMQTLDQHLKNLLTAGKITFEEAVSKAKNPRELAAMVGRKI